MDRAPRLSPGSVKPGRNDLCTCGSGRKYKKCCGKVENGSQSQAREVASRPADVTPQELIDRLRMARNTQSDEHGAALTAHHLEILLADVRLGGLDFKPLFGACMYETQTPVSPWKLPRRVYRALNLGQYFLRSLEVAGERIECGTLNGLSALLLARIAKSVDPAFTGKGFHVADSFEGLSEPKPQDAVGGRFANPKGSMACPLERVQAVLREYPDVAFHKGWIPAVLKTLPETTWAFVHVDVDLYEPTLGCLEYFVPRLAPGGIMVNDDYSSPMFPGGATAWDEYCKRHGLAFAALDTGQAVLLKGL